RLLVSLLGLGNRRDEVRLTTGFDDALSRLAVFVELPMTLRAIVRGIKNRLFKKLVRHPVPVSIQSDAPRTSAKREADSVNLPPILHPLLPIVTHSSRTHLKMPSKSLTKICHIDNRSLTLANPTHPHTPG